MSKVFKRITAFILMAAVFAPYTVWADTEPETDVSQLRVSDDFAAKHPGGMFEVLAPRIQTSEGEEFDFYVLRRGGTQGEVSVNIKAIEISAKYGEDFVLQERDVLGFYHDLKKSEDNPTLFETQIEENKSLAFTTDRLTSGQAIQPYILETDDNTASGAALEGKGIQTADDTVSGSALEPEEKSDGEVPQLISIDEGLEMEKNAPDVKYSDNMGGYTSALHKMHDEAVGKTTTAYRDEAAHSLDSFFEPDDETKQAAEAMSKSIEAAEGISYTMTFADGEAYKLLHVKIIDDDVYETQDVLELALCTPTNGSELGSRITSVMYINDDEEVEKCELGFEKESYEAFADAEGITVKLVRKGNVNDFLSVYVSTLADSAKSDEHYVPVMGSVDFLPEETEKKIYIPFIGEGLEGLTEKVGFDITAETEDNAVVTRGKTHIDILPYSNNDNKSLVNYSDVGDAHTISAKPSVDEEISPISASNNTFNLTTPSHPDGKFSVSTHYNFWKDGLWVKSKIEDYVDLVGVDHIDYHFEGGNWTGQNRLSFNGGGYEDRNGGSVSHNRTISSKDMNGMRNKSVKLEISLFTIMSGSTLTLSNVICTYTNFKLNLQKPDDLKYYVYTGTDENSRKETKSFSPGTTANGQNETSDNPSSQVDYIKDESIYARGELSGDGRNYGCSVKEVVYTGNNTSRSAKNGDEVKLDDDFIINYIYNGDQSKDTISAKAVFERTEKVDKIHIEPYSHGQFKVGGVVYNDQDITSSLWCKNDLLRPEIIPDQGYHIQSITANGKSYKYGDDIPLTQDMSIKVEFEKDNKHVTVKHDMIGVIEEDKESNALHGYVTGVNMTGDVVINDVETIRKALAEKKAEAPKEIMEKPMSMAEFARTLPMDEAQSLEIVLSYIADKPELAYKFENELPYIYSKSYKSYKEIPYVHLLKLISYYKNGLLGTTKASVDDLKYRIAETIYHNERAEKAFEFESKEIFFGLKREYKYIYNNGEYSTAGADYRDLTEELAEAIIEDDFRHLNEEQIAALNESHLADFSSPTDIDGMYIYFADHSLSLFPNSDVESLYEEYLEKHPEKYEKYLEEVNGRNEEKKKAYNEYLAQVNELQTDLNKAIEENMSKLAGMTGHIDNLSLGDTVSLYAKTEEGYTALWLYTDDASSADTKALPIYSVHIGDTFSFQVKADNAEVSYCFVKINSNKKNAVITGQIIKPAATLRSPASKKVDIKDKSTYTGAAGVDVTIGSLDPTQSEEVDGKTYKVSTTTDQDGYFSVLVPHGTQGYYTNLIFGNGGETLIKHSPMLKGIGKNEPLIIYELPFQNENFWVKSFEFNCNEDKTNGITLEDKTITATAEFSVADGYEISQVVLRSYDDSGGVVKEWHMDKENGEKYTSSFNAREYLRDGGKLTIEAYDIYGRGCGAVETGVTFTQQLDPVSVKMPEIDDMGLGNLDFLGELSPGLDMGAAVVELKKESDYNDGSGAYSGTATAVTGSEGGSEESSTEATTQQPKYEAYDFHMGSGALVKAAIGQAGRDGSTVFVDGSASQRVAKLASVLIDPAVTNITVKPLQPAPPDSDIDKKAYNSKNDLKAAGDSRSTPGGFAVARAGKLKWNIKFGLGYYMRVFKTYEGGNVKYFCDQIYIIGGFLADARDDISIYVGPVPIYITLAGGVTIKGVWGIIPNAGALQYTEGMQINTEGSSDAGLFGVLPRLTVGAGVGWRGFISGGISGDFNMNFALQDAKTGAGTFQFGLNVDLDLAFIPISFRVLTITEGMFYGDGMIDNDWLKFSAAANKNSFPNYVKSLSQEKPEGQPELFPKGGVKTATSSISAGGSSQSGELRGVMGAISRGSGNSFITTNIRVPDETSSAQAISLANNAEGEDGGGITPVFERQLSGTLKHPSPQIMHLGGGRFIMFYMGDDLSRDDYDCQTLYYMIYDNGSWSQPVILDDDGTADLDYSVAQAGDKVMVVYSDLDSKFGDAASDVPDYLDSADLSFCVFDSNGNISVSKTLTKADEFSNSMPRIAYNEETGRTFIAYLTMDYTDTNSVFAYDTVQDLDRFLNNAYSTVCYKMLDSDFNEIGYSENEATYIAYEDHYGSGSLDNQRFMPLVEDTLGINEMSAHTYGDKAFVTYTVDRDGSTDTNEDMEIYASVVDINNNSSFGPIRLTSNEVQDSNPQTVEYDNSVYLYWNRDGNVVCTDISMELAKDVMGADDGYAIEDMPYTLVQNGADAAQTFDVSVQPDGRLYIIWNQLDSKTEFDENGENPSEVKRSLYMRIYDPHFSSEEITDPETGEPTLVYSGRWGAALAYDVPEENNTLYSEQSFVALDNETMMGAFRRSTLETDGGGNTSISANSDIVMHGYRVVSSVDITDVYTEPEYPTSGHDAVLYVKAENVGVVPCESVTFSATMTDSDGVVTDLGECVVNTHCAAAHDSGDPELGDDEAEGMFTFRVPDTGDHYKFTIKAHEDGLTENEFVGEYEFEKSAVIENIDPVLNRTNNDEEDITAVFANHGNKATGDLLFKVRARGGEEGTVELLSIPVESIEPNATASVQESVDISEIWTEGTAQTLFISLEDEEGNVFYRESTDIYLIRDEDLEVTDIIINDGDEGAIEVNAGETVYPRFQVAPYGAEKSSRLVYSISDPTIAEIDPSNGSLYGKKEGIATVTVTAVKKGYSLFVDENDNTFDNKGKLVLFNRDGITEDIGDISDETVVMSKTVSVRVKGSLPETTTEITTEPTTETAAETTTAAKPSGGDSHRAGGKAVVAKTSTEATTEALGETPETSSEEESQNYKGFEDVQGLWCEDTVNALGALGLIKGRTENIFAPNDSLTRAELVQLIARLSGVDLSAYTAKFEGFTDVNENAWYYKAVMWAADNNIVYGVGEGKFAPEQSITRQDLAAIIYRYLSLEPTENTVSFIDGGDISDYASEAVGTLFAEGIISGYPDNTFRPKNSITRAEIASIVYKIKDIG